MNVQEEIEKAFMAGFDCAIANVEVYDGDVIDTWPGFNLHKAITDYINNHGDK